MFNSILIKDQSTLHRSFFVYRLYRSKAIKNRIPCIPKDMVWPRSVSVTHAFFKLSLKIQKFLTQQFGTMDILTSDNKISAFSKFQNIQPTGTATWMWPTASISTCWPQAVAPSRRASAPWRWTATHRCRSVGRQGRWSKGGAGSFCSKQNGWWSTNSWETLGFDLWNLVGK